MTPIAAFFVMISVFVGGKADVIRVTCPDVVCVGKTVETAAKRPEVTRVRVYDREPAKFGPGDIFTPALADYAAS